MSTNFEHGSGTLSLFGAYFRIAGRLVRHLITGKHHEFVVSTTFGSRIAGNTSDFIPRKLYLFGIWEPNLTNWVNGRLGFGDIFVDVGANLGYYALLAAKLVGETGAVIAIEASPLIFEELAGNVALNEARNVRTVNVAASDQVGALKLYRGPAGNSSQTSVISSAGFTYECEIQALPLCSILTSAEIAMARIIKIDVEGAEWSVIEGLAPCLSKTRWDLEVLVEVSPVRLKEFNREPKDVIALFDAAGFHAYTIENEYPSIHYVPPLKIKRPRRLRTTVARQVDMIFSRIDAESL